MTPSSHTPPAGERLQNILAARGIASRRGAADIIRAGRVTVNGETITEPGFRVTADADLLLDGNEISAEPEERHTYIYNKPAGEVSSTDGQGARTVLDIFAGLPYRLVPVGRLDKDSEGLLLISNDGNLIQHLTHPRYAHTKTYEVDVDLQPTQEQMETLRSPLTLEGYTIRPVPVERLDSRRLKFVLSEGRHRQIRLMCEQAGLRVQRLRRVELSGLALGNLRVGRYRELTPQEITRLLQPHPGPIQRRQPALAPRGASEHPTPHHGGKPAFGKPTRFDGRRNAPRFDGRRSGDRQERYSDERRDTPSFDGRRNAPRFDGRRDTSRFNERAGNRTGDRFGNRTDTPRSGRGYGSRRGSFRHS